MVLFGVATTRPAEIEWLTRGLGRLLPEQWARFRDGVPATQRDGDLCAAYNELLHDPQPAVREKAARDWCRWEDALVMLQPDEAPNPRYDDPDFRMAFARIVTHYWRHHAWLEDGILLRESSRLAGIPGVMVHGRLDLGSPLATPWELAQVWPDSELVIVDGAGHFGPAMIEHIVAATDSYT
jgi:proline iminopeptidase